MPAFINPALLYYCVQFLFLFKHSKWFLSYSCLHFITIKDKNILAVITFSYLLIFWSNSLWFIITYLTDDNIYLVTKNEQRKIPELIECIKEDDWNVHSINSKMNLFQLCESWVGESQSYTHTELHSWLLTTGESCRRKLVRKERANTVIL